MSNDKEVHDMDAYSEQWLTASPEQREALQLKYLHHLTQMETELALASAIAQQVLAPSSPLEIGRDHIDKGRYDDAFQVLSDALRHKTEATPVPAILFQLGRLASARQLNEDAKELFYQATLRDVELVKSVIDFYIDRVARASSGQK